MMLDTAMRVLIVASLVSGFVDSFQIGPHATPTTTAAANAKASATTASTTAPTTASTAAANAQYRPRIYARQLSASSIDSDPNALESIGGLLNESFQNCKSEITKTCKVAIGPSPTTGRLGLVATGAIKKGETFLSMPYDERIELSAKVARTVVFADVLAEDYEGWTGDTGLIALQILSEVAKSGPERPAALQAMMDRWVESLPSPGEMKATHPLLWSEDDQEILQASSTNKIYQALDDVEEDANWLIENVFANDRAKFPETVEWNGFTIPCFSLEGYIWAMALAKSRSVFVGGTLRLLPIMDFCNHEDDGEEVSAGFMGTFGTIKGAQLVAQRKYAEGEEVFCSYGPKSAADYLMEHGFCPPQCLKTAVSELSFEIDSEDRFYDDKLDILEFETYDQAPMDPVQKFDIVSAPGQDGEPDPAMMQFVRLAKLGAVDAFLLESIFRKEVWGFMSMPVSERNELDVVTAISEACEKALDSMSDCKEGGPAICTQLRESETKALTRTLEFLQREKEALDLKEYYQERRLKDLGLDSEWSPEDDIMGGDDLSFGQTRTPGGADYDW